MNRFLQWLCVVHVLAILGSATVNAATLSQNAVRTYDSDTNANTVDATAAGSIDLASFSDAVAAAFDNDAGGVIDFDVAELTGIHQIEAAFGVGASKTITLVNGDDSTWTNITGGGRTPISGTSMLGKHCSTSPTCTNDAVWDISVSSGEVVKSMGVTALSRDGRPFDITVVATFDDSSTQSLSATLAGTEGGDDTFFAIEAPDGRYITRFAVNNGLPFVDDPDNTGSFGSIDDIAFTVVPEPSSWVLVLCIMVVAPKFTRRRR